MSLLKNVFEINILPPAPLKGVDRELKVKNDRELLNYLGITDNLSPSLFYFWNFCTHKFLLCRINLLLFLDFPFLC